MLCKQLRTHFNLGGRSFSRYPCILPYNARSAVHVHITFLCSKCMVKDRQQIQIAQRQGQRKCFKCFLIWSTKICTVLPTNHNAQLQKVKETATQFTHSRKPFTVRMPLSRRLHTSSTSIIRNKWQFVRIQSSVPACYYTEAQWHTYTHTLTQNGLNLRQSLRMTCVEEAEVLGAN